MDQTERLAAIQRKEAELSQREAALRAQEIDVDDGKEPNFPPFFHMVYHDIKEEIPIRFQAFVRTAFIFFFFYVITYFFNFFTCCFSGYIDAPNHHVGYYVIFSLVYFLLGTVLDFQTNYYRLYKMTKKDDIGMSWIVVQILMVIYVGIIAAGFVDGGSMGVISMIDMLQRCHVLFPKVLAIIDCVLLLLVAVSQVYLFIRGLTAYKSSAAPSNSPNMVAPAA